MRTETRRYRINIAVWDFYVALNFKAIKSNAGIKTI